MFGKPVIAGTRITVEHILRCLAAGDALKQIIAVRFNSAAISTSSSRKGALRALSGIWPQTKPDDWTGTPDKRQGAFRGDIEVWESIGKVKQTGQQWKQIIEDYPPLTVDDIRAAQDFAAGNVLR